jgi:hypothetical protein
MVHLAQVVLSFLASRLGQLPVEPASLSPSAERTTPNVNKTVVVVGTGSAGLAALKALLDLPPDVRAGWDIVAYEQRSGVGGVWRADGNDVPAPPLLPETPLYPDLHTNTPVPVMTFPGFPFPAGTPLYPSHDHIARYHEAYAEALNLTPHIHFDTEVVAARWQGTPDAGWWNVTVRHGGQRAHKRVDHLVVANGHNHYPHYPDLIGLSTWLSGAAGREASHSIYYRTPDKYTNRTVLVIGGGSSGRDAARLISSAARTTYQSLKPADTEMGTAGGVVETVPVVASLNATSVLLVNGTALHDVDALVLATGYELRIPFLSAPHSSAIREIQPQERVPDSRHAQTLVTNQRYLYPLHAHVLSLSPALPPAALAVIGLPMGVANCFSDSAQALYAAHAIANASVLPPREDLLDELVAEEAQLAAIGHDVYVRGARLTAWPAHSHDYADALVQRLRERGALPPGAPYTDAWRRWAWNRPILGLSTRAWQRIRALGPDEELRWTADAHSEEDWVRVMQRVAKWQEQWEREHGVVAGDVEPSFDY